MNRIFLFCALGALWGCRQAAELSGEAITLSCSTSESSKVGALTAGDAVAVYARIEGTEDYFLEAAKYGVGSDGQSLTYGSTVYYPEPKQAVNFYAYFPYHTGSFSVPSDQSTAAALKQADLCWATASTTPVSTPVSLEFSHLFARLIVQTNEPTEKIACRVVPSGVLNAATAQFTLNNNKSEVFTTGNELILPVQPLSRLVLTVSGIEYIFEGSIILQTGQTTTLNLTLHPNTKTATLNGSSTTDWTTSNQQGVPTQSASNVLTIHWPKCHPESPSVDKVVLTLKDHSTNTTVDCIVSSGITYTNQQFVVPVESTQVHYPYTIVDVALYRSGEWLHRSMNIIGATITKRGACTVGIQQPLNPPTVSDYIEVGGLRWATGNLVAVSKDNHQECKVGAPADGGLYFQFGSLIGYKGGNQANGGTGTGMPSKADGTWWTGGSYSWAGEAQVWPANLSGNPSSWPQGASTNQWYFGLQSGWSSSGQNIYDYPGFAAGGLSNVGVGDPCTYYLGGTWRLPTTNEYVALCNNKSGINAYFSWADAGGSWTTSPTSGGNFSSNRLFFPASGNRYYSHGSFSNVTAHGFGWSSSVSGATSGFNLGFYSSWVYPQHFNSRSNGFPVRCVSE